MKNKYIILAALTLSTGLLQSIFGQQTPVFSSYSDNAVVFNSAFAGFYSDTDITFANSGHLNAVEGSPKNTSLIINTPTGSDHVGVGGGFYSDEIGVTSVTRVFGAYSYKLFFNSDRRTWWSHNPHVLSFGISAGAMFYTENLLELEIQDDPNFSSNINKTVPTLGVGILYNRKKAYIGLSAANLLGASISPEDNIDLKADYYLYGGYRFFATRFEEILINPSVLAKYVSGAPAQVDLNTKINYKNKFEIGAGYRSNSSLNFLAGFYIADHFKISYSYNKTLKNTIINDSHGIVVGWRLGNGFI